jgi:23S rRNA pseudouridine1911/1915/1917 synthase
VPDRTRSALRRLIAEGHVTVDGATAGKAGLAVKPGMRLSIEIPDPASLAPGPEAIPVEVLFEDDDLLVLVKPAGLVVHPGHGNRTGTLINALLGRGTTLAQAGGAARPGIVHRLDRGTSGLLVVAKTDVAHRALQSSFSLREVEKTYLALVWGHPSPAAGKIDRAIGRSRADPTRMSTHARNARSATTLYRTVRTLPGFALLEISLVTGRTHQIRVHLSSIGHPVVGDPSYGSRSWKTIQDPARRDAIRRFERVALHAQQLAFRHPTTGKDLRFTAPLPEEFEALLRSLHSAA